MCENKPNIEAYSIYNIDFFDVISYFRVASFLTKIQLFIATIIKIQNASVLVDSQ